MHESRPRGLRFPRLLRTPAPATEAAGGFSGSCGNSSSAVGSPGRLWRSEAGREVTRCQLDRGHQTPEPRSRVWFAFFLTHEPEQSSLATSPPGHVLTSCQDLVATN